jgi:uncharacterized protein YceH (UPF0502 family)
LPRQPGKREARYAHRVGDEAFPIDDGTAAAGNSVDQGSHDRIDALELRVAELQAQVAALREMVETLIARGPNG